MKKIIIIALLAGSVVTQSCKKDSHPEACFNVDVMETVETGHEFIFTNCSENYSSVLWEFYDGTTSTETNPHHVFSSRGNRLVKLTVTNKDGEKSSTEKSILYGYYLLEKMVVTKTWNSVSFPKNLQTMCSVIDIFSLYLNSNSQLPATIQNSSSLCAIYDFGSSIPYIEYNSTTTMNKSIPVFPHYIINKQYEAIVVNPPSDTARLTLHFKIGI